jgi:hypothetical protein
MNVHITLPNDIQISIDVTDPHEIDLLVNTWLKHLSNPLNPSNTLKLDPYPTKNTPANPSIQNEPSDSEPTIGYFQKFCANIGPVGDMRRTIVAAEGARRFLQIDKVSIKELQDLFKHAHWQYPANFAQTLRNASRKSFGWLERVPGREGYYTVSDKGRTLVINSG